jgi:hypothetical protein
VILNIFTGQPTMACNLSKNPQIKSSTNPQYQGEADQNGVGKEKAFYSGK